MSCSGASAQEQLEEPAPRAPALSSELIRQAVKDTLAAEPAAKRNKLDGRVLSGEQYTRFSRAFAEAQVPGCLQPGALKHQPTGFQTKNWVFEVAGLPAAPFWAYAALTGKCRILRD